MERLSHRKQRCTCKAREFCTVPGLLSRQPITVCKHVEKQLVKGRKAYCWVNALLHSRALNSKVKMLCYLLLVRPILTYACQIWFNVGPPVMEKLRKFERDCLRAYLNMYKSPKSNYTRYYSNKELYNATNIKRIDYFILKLTRDHIANSSKMTNNSLIYT